MRLLLILGLLAITLSSLACEKSIHEARTPQNTTLAAAR